MSTSVTIENIKRFLKEIWAFERLTAEQINELAQLVHVKKLEAGQALWMQGQRVTFFSMVYDGKLRSIRQTIKGSEKLVTTLTRGYHFGLAEMITQQDSAVTLTAEKAATLLIMDVKLLKEKLLKHPEICYRLMQTMARTIFSLTLELERASFETVHMRLARLLLSKQINRLGLPSPKPGEGTGFTDRGQPGNRFAGTGRF